MCSTRIIGNWPVIRRTCKQYFGQKNIVPGTPPPSSNKFLHQNPKETFPSVAARRAESRREVFLKIGESVKKRHIFPQNRRKFSRYFLPKSEKATAKFSKAGGGTLPPRSLVALPLLSVFFWKIVGTHRKHTGTKPCSTAKNMETRRYLSENKPEINRARRCHLKVYYIKCLFRLKSTYFENDA